MMVYEIYSEVQLKQYFDFQTCTYLNYKIKIQETKRTLQFHRP